MTLDAFTRTLGFSYMAREVRDNRLGLTVPAGSRILDLPRQPPPPNSQEWLAPLAAAPRHSSHHHKQKASKRDRTCFGLSLLTEATAGKEKLMPEKMCLGSNLELQQCCSRTVPCAS